MVALAASCSGGGGGGPAILGTWEVTSVTGGDPNDFDPVFVPGSVWLRVESDNTFNVLNQSTPNAFHTIRSGVVTPGTSQVSFDGRLFNYTVGTALVLSRPDTTVVAQRATAPAVDTWEVPVTAVSPTLTLSTSVVSGVGM